MLQNHEHQSQQERLPPLVEGQEGQHYEELEVCLDQPTGEVDEDRCPYHQAERRTG